MTLGSKILEVSQPIVTATEQRRFILQLRAKQPALMSFHSAPVSICCTCHSLQPHTHNADHNQFVLVWTRGYYFSGRDYTSIIYLHAYSDRLG